MLTTSSEFRALCVNRPTQPWNSVFLRLPAPPSLLHLVKLREVREREFLGIRGAPRHCEALCNLTSQVLELYRLGEIVVLHQVSCPRNSLHCTPSRCFFKTFLPSGCFSLTALSRLQAVFLQRSITVGRDECLPCLLIGDDVAL